MLSNDQQLAITKQEKRLAYHRPKASDLLDRIRTELHLLLDAEHLQLTLTCLCEAPARRPALPLGFSRPEKHPPGGRGAIRWQEQ
jgi:hypothetical protein